MSSATITRRQRQVLDFLAAYAEQHGYPPSIREIGQAIGLQSSSTVFSHLRTLQARGLVKGNHGQPRSYMPVNGRQPGLRKAVAAFVAAWDSPDVAVTEADVAAFVERARRLL